MYATTSKTIRLVSAALAVAIGTTLVLAKAHYSDEYSRLATRSDVIVLPVAEVIGDRAAASLAATMTDQRTN